MTWQSVEKGIRTRRKNLEIKKRSSHETHARERRLLRALAGYEGTGRKQVTMNHRGSPEGQAGFEVMFWCNPETEDIFFVLADSEGVPIISDELNAALVESLGEKEGAKP